MKVKVMRKLVTRLLLFAGMVAAAVIPAHAAAPDASAIVTTANTTFEAVGALVASAVGFFVIVKLVKWIRK